MAAGLVFPELCQWLLLFALVAQHIIQSGETFPPSENDPDSIAGYLVPVVSTQAVDEPWNPVFTRTVQPERWPVPPDPAVFGGTAWNRDGIVAIRAVDAGYVRYGRFVFPRLVEALIDRPGVPLCQVRVEIAEQGGAPAITRFTIGSRDGERISSESPRVPLKRFLKEIRQLVGGTVPDPDGGIITTANSRMVVAKDDGAAFEIELAPSRGKPLTSEHLENVARVYREALQAGDNPTDTVSWKLNTSRSTAGRWVVRARREGFLGPAIPGRPGESTR